MKSNSSLKIILITVACILIAALSFFYLAGILSSPETYSGILRSIDDKVQTVLKLTASSTAASAGITAIPGDAGTPIAEKLAEFSEYGILILCVLYAEKYLLSILGSGVFKFIIPIACVLYPLGFFRDLEGIKPILKKIAIVSLALYFVIPLSVHISDRIYDTYQASIDTTITAAEDLAEDATLAGSTAEDQNATSCVIPLLVLFFSLWIINQVFGFSIPAPSRHPRLRPHLPGPHRRLGSGSTVTEESEDEDEEKE